jgi:hypothetical protein
VESLDRHPLRHAAAYAYNPQNRDKYYSAVGMANAKSGFGGYIDNQMYAGDASVTTSSDIHAHTNVIDLSGVLNGGS